MLGRMGEGIFPRLLSSVSPYPVHSFCPPPCGLFQAFNEFLCEAQVQQLHGGEGHEVGKGLEEPLPAQLQQAGHRKPDLKQRASSLVLMDIHYTTVDVHTASLERAWDRTDRSCLFISDIEYIG